MVKSCSNQDTKCLRSTRWKILRDEESFTIYYTTEALRTSTEKDIPGGRNSLKKMKRQKMWEKQENKRTLGP